MAALRLDRESGPIVEADLQVGPAGTAGPRICASGMPTRRWKKFASAPPPGVGTVTKSGSVDSRHLLVGFDATVGVMALSPIHEDPFDRMLVAHAVSEAITLLTSDDLVARSPGPIGKV